jgi:hypothetical protein
MDILLKREINRDWSRIPIFDESYYVSRIATLASDKPVLVWLYESLRGQVNENLDKEGLNENPFLYVNYIKEPEYWEERDVERMSLKDAREKINKIDKERKKANPYLTPIEAWTIFERWRINHKYRKQFDSASFYIKISKYIPTGKYQGDRIYNFQDKVAIIKRVREAMWGENVIRYNYKNVQFGEHIIYYFKKVEKYDKEWIRYRYQKTYPEVRLDRIRRNTNFSFRDADIQDEIKEIRRAKLREKKEITEALEAAEQKIMAEEYNAKMKVIMESEGVDYKGAVRIHLKREEEKYQKLRVLKEELRQQKIKQIMEQMGEEEYEASLLLPDGFND